MRALLQVGRDGLLSKLINGSLIVAGSCLLASCAGRGGSVPYEPQGFMAPDFQAEPIASANTPIGALDALQVSVFQVEALTGEYQVDESGQIDYPLLGMVQAQGRTTEELGKALASGLSQRYLQAPKVNVSIKERAKQKVTVEGSVNQPGVFEVTGPTTLLQAVAMARGTSREANPSRVVVFRTIRGERMAGAFDLQDIRRAKAADPVIYGNDIVVVDGSRARALYSDLMNSIGLLSVLRPY
jgi:polysaccharide export outer membrane protein